MCLDFRQLNKTAERPIFPIPNVDEIFDSMGKAKYFSTIDLGQAYYQVELTEDSKLKTAFSTKTKQYCFNRMPFGIAAAPATFQKLMNKVIDDLNWKVAITYLDDIIVFSPSKEQHYKDLESVFEKIKNSGLKVKPTKCHFLNQKVKFLGHELSQDGLATDPSKITAIQQRQRPKCLKELRSFLGLANYYRRFIKDYSKYSKCLENMCGSTLKKLEWNEECDNNFNELKKQLCQSPVLCHPDFNKTFILDTDASFDRIGAVLSQKDENNHERVIAYGSHSLNRHELGYCVTRKELLAVFYFVNHFKHYLHGKRFTLRTDHKAITFMMKTKNPITPQFQTWISYLSSLDIDFVYRKGNDHSNADALSRQNCTTCTQCQTIHENAMTTKIKTKVISIIGENTNKWQTNSQEINEIMQDIIDEKSKFRLSHGTIITEKGKIWIPQEKRKEFIKEYHKKLCHAGALKCTKYIQNNFDMKNIYDTVKEVIGSCEFCQKRKTFTGTTKEKHVQRTTRNDFEIIHADFCGPMRMTKNGRKYVLAIIDSKTKYIRLKAVNQQDEATFVKTLKEDWILKYGAPRILHTDRGRTFEGRKLAQLSEECGFKQEYSSPYHHSSNGQIERQFRTIRDAIETTMKDSGNKDWSELIPEIEHMLNGTYQTTIKMSPAEAVFGRTISRENHQTEELTYTEETASSNRSFKVGDKVLVKRETTRKDEDRYEGPAEIEEKIHERSFRVKMPDGTRKIRNIEWLRIFKEGVRINYKII